MKRLNIRKEEEKPNGLIYISKLLAKLNKKKHLLRRKLQEKKEKKVSKHAHTYTQTHTHTHTHTQTPEMFTN